MGHRLPIAKMLKQVYDANIFMLSYRGYGLSEGTANEKGMKLDVKVGCMLSCLPRIIYFQE
jgi:abhydrolase domain-containing protein 13